jgi:uncharacterized protein YdiU (UPF0061 family)
MSISFPFDNSYARLPARLFTRQQPTPVSRPALIVFNQDLARDLGIHHIEMTSDEAAQIFSGNVIPDGAAPLAQVYAGHQFGHFNPQLGDGRAILLGELLRPDGQRRDIQLKGSGRTPYSRSGDGRAWLGPVLREYLVSEAMHALGVPTTRALAAVTTGELIYRDAPLPGAVLTRIAASHLRVGTFQFFAARNDIAALRELTDYAIARHYPGAEGPAGLLTAMMHRQARLIAQWMGLGFIHGVMNTDNCAISGETIDYGPCAFMDSYHPQTVFSAIDQGGRYAYGNQPQIAIWNIAQFATALIPLMDDRDAAIDSFSDIVNTFPDLYAAAWLKVFGAKIGLAGPAEEDRPLIEGLLALMARDQADFTNTFRHLAEPDAKDQFLDRSAFGHWRDQWLRRNPDPDLMARTNPAVIPRTHLIEAAITAAVAGDFAPFDKMLDAVTAPYAPEPSLYTRPPKNDEKVLQTFCGT